MGKIIELINNFDSLFGIFIPGAVCVWFYTKLSLKKYEAQVYFVMSIAIGYIIQWFVYNHLVMPLLVYNVHVSSFALSLVFAIALAFVYYKVKNSFFVRSICVKVFGIESGDNLWTRLYDGKRGTAAYIYLSNGKVVFGLLTSADNDYLTVIGHCTTSIEDADDDNDLIDDTVLCIPMSKVDRFELMYTNDTSPYEKYNIKRFLGEKHKKK
jgi:hypothetical protein